MGEFVIEWLKDTQVYRGASLIKRLSGYVYLKRHVKTAGGLYILQ